MTREIVHQDVTDNPELARLAEEVRSSMQPRYLEKHGQRLAKVTPVAPRKPRRRSPTDADREAFLSAFGSWKGIVDVDRLRADLEESRKLSRPPAEL
jgi:hypothetical protein